METQLREAVRVIRSLLAERAPGWQVDVIERQLGGADGVVIEASHNGAEPYRWAMTAVSATRAVETVRTALERDPEFRLVKDTPAIEHRAIVVGLRRLAAEHGWTAGAVGEVAELLAREDVLTADEAAWLTEHVHEATEARRTA